MNSEILFVQNLAATREGRIRLEHFRLLLLQNEYSGLLGLYGSGKKILAEIIAGQAPYDKGEIFLFGKPAQAGELRKVVRLIGENDRLIHDLSVAANIFASNSRKKSFVFFDKSRMNLEASLLLDEFELSRWLTAKPASIPKPVQHMLLIINAFVSGKQLIILDNITIDYEDADLERLTRFLSLLKQKKVSILIMSSSWNRVYNLVDRTHIIRNGRNLKTFWHEQPGQSEVTAHLTNIKGVLQPFPENNLYYSGTDSAAAETSDKNLISRPDLVIQGKVFEPGTFIGLYDEDGSKALFLKDLLQKNPVKKPSVKYLENYSVDKHFIMQMSLIKNCEILFSPVLKRWHGVVDRDIQFFIRDELERKLHIERRYFDLPINYIRRFERFKILLYTWRLQNPALFLFDNTILYADERERKRLMEEMWALTEDRYCVLLILTNKAILRQICPTGWSLSKGRIHPCDFQT